jgi:hypothetical protein
MKRAFLLLFSLLPLLLYAQQNEGDRSNTIDKAWLYDKINKESDLIENLIINKIGIRYEEVFLNIISEIAQSNWQQSDYDNLNDFILGKIELPLELDGQTNIEISGCYQFGKLGEYTFGTQLGTDCINQFTTKALMPIRLIINEKDKDSYNGVVLPAVVVKYLCEQLRNRQKMELINLSLSLMMPQMIVSKVNIARAATKVDDIFITQKKLVDQYKNTIASANNIRKGNFGEIASDVFLSEKGYQPLHTRITNIDAPIHQGIDGVFVKNGQYFILEAKYGTATLNPENPATNLPKQMTDAWIRGDNRLIRAVQNQSTVDDI